MERLRINFHAGHQIPAVVKTENQDVNFKPMIITSGGGAGTGEWKAVV